MPSLSQQPIDKETLRLVYNRLSNEIIEFIKLLWENVKFFASLLTALVTIDIYLTNMIYSINIENHPISPILSIFSLILPILILALTFIGQSELRRRWARLVENVASRAKVEALLGIHNDLSEEFKKLGVLSDDKYIHQRFAEVFRKYRSTDELIQRELTISKRPDILRGKNFYVMMSRIYTIFKVISIILLALKILIISAFIL